MTAPQAGDSGAPLAQPVDSLGGWSPLPRPELRRWRPIHAVVPLLILAIAIATAVVILRRPHPATPPIGVGACVKVSGVQSMGPLVGQLGLGSAKVVSCDAPHNAKITAKVSRMFDCPDGQSWLMTTDSDIYCIAIQ